MGFGALADCLEARRSETVRSEPGMYRWPIVKVVDGDTLKVDARADMPPELARLHVRLRGVDTPEKGGRAKCDAERRAGRAATAFTAAAVAGARSDNPQPAYP